MALVLDDEQERAIRAPEQRVRVLAGAGTGKTTTLIGRARYLLDQGVHPRHLCIVTFTRRAAEELARRIGPQGTGVLIGTIHALGYRILRYERLGRSVADPRKTKQLILEALRASTSKEPLNKVAVRVHRAKDFGVPYPADVRAIGERYDQLLTEHNVYDFSDLILVPRALLRDNELVAGRWRERFHHLLIDEAQDTSTIQWDLLECLTTPATHTYSVGDVGQSIYSWRGAESLGLLSRFAEGATTYTIGRNYRSRPTIIDVANRVLREKPGAVELSCTRDRDALYEGGAVYRPTVFEAAQAALLGLRLHGQWRPVDIAVLGRTHAALGQVELACASLGIPYFLVGGVSFYNRAEVLDVLAHLEYAAGVDRSAALDRFFNKPSRYLGAAWMAALNRQGGWATWEAHGPRAFTWPQPYMGQRAWDLWQVCQRLRMFGADAPAVAVVDYVLHDVGYAAWVRKDGMAEAEAAEDNDIMDNLTVLRKTAEPRGTAAEFITFVDACRHRPQRVEGAGGVTLSTIHRAKGLEWPVVVVAGCEEGMFPHSLATPEGEERRVYYVAVTRPQEQLILAASGVPSRYVRESTAALGWVVPEWPEEGVDGGASEPDAGASGAAGDADRGPAVQGNGDGVGTPVGGADRSAGPDGAGVGPGGSGDG